MERIKLFGLFTTVSLIVMIFAGASPTNAETTALCATDGNPCASAKQVSHVHETTLSGSKTQLLTSLEVNRIYHVHEATTAGSKAQLLASVGTVECDLLFLGDTDNLSPLGVTGALTYTNCKLGGSSCSAGEENGPTEIEVSKEAHETAKVVGEGLVHVVCGGFIDCSYNGTGLVSTAKGPLLSMQTNGEVTLSGQSVSKEAGGFLCPKTAKLDITTSPLSATYVSS